MTRLSTALLVVASAWLSTAYESRPTTTTAVPAATAASANSTPLVAATYSCPMGCEGSAGNQPGKCPVCGMVLEHNPDFKPALR